VNTFLLAALGPVTAGLVFGVVVLIDKLREPHRNPTHPYPVVDARTYRRAQHRIARLEAAGQVGWARATRHACRVWLRGEIRTGPKRRRALRAAQLEQVELRLEETLPV
jgi:hypothetical protein